MFLKARRESSLLTTVNKDGKLTVWRERSRAYRLGKTTSVYLGFASSVFRRRSRAPGPQIGLGGSVASQDVPRPDSSRRRKQRRQAPEVGDAGQRGQLGRVGSARAAEAPGDCSGFTAEPVLRAS